MALEELFCKAADALQVNSLGGEGSIKVEETTLLELYGLYKVGTMGPCKESQPGIFNLKGRAKWTAWQQVSGLSVDEAKGKYIELVKSVLKWSPTQIENKKDKHQLSGPSVGFGNAVSSFALPPEDLDEAKNDPDFLWISWARDNDLVNLEKWAANVPNINIQDKNGLTALHWAVDRGHLPAARLLLNHGANPSLEDNDGSSSLEYAETCEYENIVELIKQYINKSEK